MALTAADADQQVRGAIVLPNGTGKSVRVLAICKPEKEEEAKAAGADFVGGEEMVQKIQRVKTGWTSTCSSPPPT